MIDANGWFTDLPQEDGDYIWVTYWGCCCCIRQIGVGFIHDYYEGHYPNGLGDHHRFINKDGIEKVISWMGGQIPYRDGDWFDITAWKKLTHPDFELLEHSDNGQVQSEA